MTKCHISNGSELPAVLSAPVDSARPVESPSFAALLQRAFLALQAVGLQHGDSLPRFARLDDHHGARQPHPAQSLPDRREDAESALPAHPGLQARIRLPPQDRLCACVGLHPEKSRRVGQIGALSVQLLNMGIWICTASPPISYSYVP